MCCSAKLKAKLVLTAALVSVLLGLSGATCFSYFGQYTTATWCGITSVYALGVVIMHCTALQYGVRPHPNSLVSQILPATLLVGVLGMLFSMGITVYGVAYAFANNEQLNRESHYLLSVWGFMTFKWSFYMFHLSRRYNTILAIEEDDRAQLVQEGSTDSTEQFRGLEEPSVTYEEEPSVTFEEPTVNI